jgi:hypothetical protein
MTFNGGKTDDILTSWQEGTTFSASKATTICSYYLFPILIDLPIISS